MFQQFSVLLLENVLLLVSNSFSVTSNVIIEVWQEESFLQYSFSVGILVRLQKQLWIGKMLINSLVRSSEAWYNSAILLSDIFLYFLKYARLDFGETTLNATLQAESKSP